MYNKEQNIGQGLSDSTPVEIVGYEVYEAGSSLALDNERFTSAKIIPTILKMGNKICEYSGDGYTGMLYSFYDMAQKKTVIYSILTNEQTQEQTCTTLYASSDEKFIQRLLTECKKCDTLKVKGD